jgi:hypothetical protein
LNERLVILPGRNLQGRALVFWCATVRALAQPQSNHRFTAMHRLLKAEANHGNEKIGLHKLDYGELGIGNV